MEEAGGKWFWCTFLVLLITVGNNSDEGFLTRLIDLHALGVMGQQLCGVLVDMQ